MHKLLLLSVILVTIGVPIWASRDRSPARGLKKTLFALAIFAVLYLLGLYFVYPKLYYPDL